MEMDSIVHQDDDDSVVNCTDMDTNMKLVVDDTGISPPETVKTSVMSTGFRIHAAASVKEEEGLNESVEFKPDATNDLKRKVEENHGGGDGAYVARKKSMKEKFREYLREKKAKEGDSKAGGAVGESAPIGVKEEPDLGFVNNVSPNLSSDEKLDVKCSNSMMNDGACGALVKQEDKSFIEAKPIVVTKDEPCFGKGKDEMIPECPEPISSYNPYAQQRYNNVVKPPVSYPSLRPQYSSAGNGRVENQSLSCAVLEDGEFEVGVDWRLVGRTPVTALSTSKGKMRLLDNEIVHFTFPSLDARMKKSYWGSSKAAAASAAIVRFSTKRNGEIGRLPMEWAKCLIPLVKSSKVKVRGRCVAAPSELYMMQEIMLYLSFYIHNSVFCEGDKSSWRLDAPQIDSTMYPLLTLFNLLKIKPFQKAEFTPDDLDPRKSSLNLEGDAALMLPAGTGTRGKASKQFSEESKDEQAISEASLNKLVGAAEVYNLEEMEPPNTLMCVLKPYQKQALYWMTESEKGVDAERATQSLHPCWAAYRICDTASTIYVNIFSGEATTKLPTATQMARGGILADAMGLGKTVMTIALILARPYRASLDEQMDVGNSSSGGEITRKRMKPSSSLVSQNVKGETLIVCPMALLGQWKDELETHSRPDTISIFVHYGGDRTTNPEVMAQYDVVLTTYGVLCASYKSNSVNSIFHRVDWYRIVLDEAHTIKSSKTIGAQAAYALSSQCRWCLTGTPLQNNLEDLFSLLCFLHVEPWCNWAWWSKLIQRPYENGDQRGLKLIKAILRPLMLRRTKETKDKYGRPILVLPPTDIQTIECEQTEAEHDFYEALFKRSQVC